MIHGNRLRQHLGAEIAGVDLSHPLDDETFAQIAEAFFEHEVLGFRRQQLTLQPQVDFTGRFAILEPHVRPGEPARRSPRHPHHVQRAR